ncbi:MAG: hypothetical protein ACI88A_001983 [Paraglaciecola sp.]|jgi:hypothetical protein
MNLVSLNLAAEIVASIAVLISLCFLVIQLRQNFIQSKKQALEELTLRRIELLKMLYEDHDQASLIWRGFSQEPRLAAHEWVRFGFYLYSVFVVFELVHIKYLSKELDKAHWFTLLDAFHWWFQFPGVSAWWNTAPGGFTPTFITMVNEEMSKVAQDKTSAQLVGKSFFESVGTASPNKSKHLDGGNAAGV